LSRTYTIVAGKTKLAMPGRNHAEDNPVGSWTRRSERGKAGAPPEIYTLGHRDHFGLAPHPVTGLGTYGGPGADYGWPDSSYGCNNDSSPLPNPNVPGIEPGLLVWLPGITPSGSAASSAGE
jgi:glucose/arabinose dehydrogenase